MAARAALALGVILGPGCVTSDVDDASQGMDAASDTEDGVPGPDLGGGEDSSSSGESGTSGDGDGDSDSGSSGDGDGSGSGSESGDGDGDADATCQGWPILCERRFDELVMFGSHNAHASFAYGFSAFNANHNLTVTQQLERGVRVLLMDTYYGEGGIELCHGPCSLGSVPHVMVLEEIVNFIDANPTDVFAIVYQDGVSGEDLAADYAAVGAEDLLITYTGGSWPTVGQLIENGTRLLVTAESGGTPPAWHHNVWSLGWDTPYSFDSPEAFNCDLNRGDSGNRIFQINHWVGTSLGLPSEEAAMQVNTKEAVLARVADCHAQWGRLPSWFVVDFVEYGDVSGAVRQLNLQGLP